MTNTRLLLLLPLLLLALPSLAYASGCGSSPSGASYCQQLSIQNTQSSATTTNTQIMLSYNALAYQSYLAANLMNIEAYNSLSGAIIPMWLEGNVLNEQQTSSLYTSENIILWLKLPDTIAASSTDSNIYLAYFPTTTDEFSASGNYGAAPQLYCASGCPATSYAGVDNGANVFSYYLRFGGLSSLPSGWTQQGSPTFTYNTANLVISSASSSQNGAYMSIPSAFTSLPNMIDIYDNINDGYSSPDSNLGTASGTALNSDAYQLLADGQDNSNNQLYYINNGAPTVTSPAYSPPDAPEVYSLYLPTTSSETIYVNYASYGTYTISALSPTIYMLEQYGTNGQTVYWLRSRTAPPSGVQPTVTFGAVQSPTPPSSTLLYFSTANSITYGTSVSATAVCSPNTDSCAVQSTPGTNLCSGTGSCTYPIPDYLAASTYTYTANDLTSNVLNSNVLTVNGAPTYGTCTMNSAAVSNSQTFANLLETNDLISCSGSATINNQITYTLDYNSVSEGTTTSNSALTYNAVWNNLDNTAQFSNPGDGNYLSNSISWNIDYVPYVAVTNPSLSAAAYETSSENVALTVNVAKAAVTANDILNVNGVNVLSDNQNVISGNNQYTLSYTVPLVTTNNIASTFNTILSLTLGSNWGGQILTYNPYNTLTQNTLWDYVPQLNPTSSQIIEGSNITINVNVTQPDALDLATVASEVKIGNQTKSVFVSSPYHYYSKLYSFINSQYALTMPTLNSPVTVAASANTQLTFNSQTVWRNTTGSFNTYLPLVVGCGTANSANTINWSFYNATSPSTPWPENVLFSGAFQIHNQLYSSNTINGTNAGLNVNAIANNYATCIYPSWANFQVTGGFQYSANTASQADYYLQYLNVSNTINAIHLYLYGIADPIEYEVAVENVSQGIYIPALVQELLYNPNTNSSVLVDEFYTQAGSGTYVYLQNQDNYRFGAYTTTKPVTLMALTNYMQAAACSTTACPFVIQVGNFTINLIQTMLKNLQYSCNPSAGASNTLTVSCSFTSINGTSYNTSLSILNNTPGITNRTTCQKYLVTASGSLSCTATSINNTYYVYYFKVHIGNAWYTLSQGVFGSQSLAFGADGAFLALLLVVAMGFAFIVKNPTIAILGVDLAITVANFMQIINAGAMTLGFMWIASAFLAYMINRR